MKHPHRAVVLFTRSLRTVDNRALERAYRERYEVVPLFVFTPEQIDPVQNPYYSKNAVQFMVESLIDLAQHAPMLFLHDHTVAALQTVHTAIPGITAVIDTIDYTPYARSRSAMVQAWCVAKGVRYIAVEDVDLFGIHEVLRAPGEPYKVFTPYSHVALRAYQEAYGTEGKYHASPFRGRFISPEVLRPVPGRLRPNQLKRFYGGQDNPHLEEHGGRTEGVRRLAQVRDRVRGYPQDRELFGKEVTEGPGTTRLSAHLKFGTISVRELAAETVRWGGLGNGILRQLLFRSFYYKNAWFRPDQLEKQRPFKTGVVPPARPTEGAPTWEQFVRGETGVPLLDASVRCIETTGYLHNRLRLLVASYVTKDMAVDWRILEKWFGQRLVDYDPISNNAGVQTGASVGPSAGPMFRRMSPEAQARKYDPDGAFVHRWLGEDAGTKGYKASSP